MKRFVYPVVMTLIQVACGVPIWMEASAHGASMSGYVVEVLGAFVLGVMWTQMVYNRFLKRAYEREDGYFTDNIQYISECVFLRSLVHMNNTATTPEQIAYTKKMTSAVCDGTYMNPTVQAALTAEFEAMLAAHRKTIEPVTQTESAA